MAHTLISHSSDGTSLHLYDHLSQVLDISRYIIGQKKTAFHGLSQGEIYQLVSIIAVCHDFGKSTAFFQDYITSDVRGVPYRGSKMEKSHALLSAFFGWHIAEIWLEQSPHIEGHWRDFIPFAVFVAIEGHHGRYSGIDDVLNKIDNQIDLLYKQLKAVNLEIFDYIFSDISLNTRDPFDQKRLDDIHRRIRKFSRRYRHPPDLELMIEERILGMLLYSVLLEADKAYLASDNPQQYSREPVAFPSNLVDIHIQHIKAGKEIDVERTKAYNQTVSQIEQIPLSQRIHSITLPTGLGKTLLSASCALKLRERMRKEEDICPRIFVSLPFLSIIEQTDSVYKGDPTYNGFLWKWYEQHLDRLYMARYSIAPFKYRDSEEDERSDNATDFYLAIWNSEIIVTTFDQLLYSVFSLKARHLMRFHTLFNAILIFDEIQSLPSTLWKVFDLFFSTLAEVGNSHVIVMSATQPRFLPETRAHELVPEHQAYFKHRNRVELTICPQPIGLEDFLRLALTRIESCDGRSIMIVMNTKDSSKLLYKHVAEHLDSSRPLYYLSSLVAPAERVERIRQIKGSIEDGKNPVIVTTQCIEAGVDIDVDYIIRDWAPLDAIFQVCGRCNRHGLKKMGNVEIVRIISKNGRPFAQMVYDSILLNCTAEALGDSLRTTEDSFYELGSRYFRLVRERLGESMKVVQAYAGYSHHYKTANGVKEVNIRALLRGSEQQEQLLISTLDPNLRGEVKAALSLCDRWQRRYALKRLRQRIALYSVNTQLRFQKDVFIKDFVLEHLGTILVLDLERHPKLYDVGGVGLDLDVLKSSKYQFEVI